MRTRRPPHRSWDPRRTPNPAMLSRAVQAHTNGDAETAAALYVELDERYPPHWHARMMGALLHYQRTSDPTHALDILPDVILHKPLWPDPRYNLGVVLEGLGRFAEAAERFHQTVEMEPAHSQGWTNLGNCRLALGDVEGALAAFSEALALDPQDPTGLYNLSHVYGLLGRWDDTWRLYEYRWLMPGHLRDHGLPKLLPPWDGTPVGHLVVTGEQGAGDMIQYARFLTRMSMLAERVTLIVRHEALVPLLRYNFPTVDVQFIDSAVPLSEQSDRVPDADAHIPILSTVSRLGLSPRQVGGELYLTAPPVERRHAGRTIGLCWAGSATHKRDGTRSIPFETLAPLLEIPDVTWVNLTFNERGVVHDPRLVEIRDECPDYLASASQYQALDGVITVDSSPLHLAGALGVPTLGLIAAAPDFRWGLHIGTTPWYGSLTLVRQARGGEWADVVADVRARVQAGWPHQEATA